MSALRAFAELSEDGTKIEVHFKYDPAAVAAIKEVPGRRFSAAKNGRAAFWTIPADLTSATRLREEFGQGLQLGDAVKAWGHEEVRRQRNLRSLSTADDAQLTNVEPDAAAWLRPYQRADVAMMAATNVLNANQPGVGKTVEAIYAVREAGLEGPHLVVCPTSLFKDPWRDELAAHMPGARVLWGSTPDERRAAIVALANAPEAERAATWLLLNPEMIRLAKYDATTAPPVGATVVSRDHKGNAYCPKDDFGEELFKLSWGALIADEFHKFGLGENRNTQFARGLAGLRKNARRAYALSGTPMGGKPVRLWGVLNFIEPQLYSGKWKWAQQWLTNADGSGPVVPGEGTGIGGIIPGREDEFYKAHAKHLVRRTRKEALPGLPDKVVINVSTPMTPKQRKAYDALSTSAEASIDGGNVLADGILAEFARLKQFANALCEINDRGEIVPTEESGKLPVVIDRLDTYGIRKDSQEPGARAIVASESQRMVVMVESRLAREGLNVRRLDGTVTGARRDEVIDWYKADAPDARVLVMTTQTGGVGLNLGMTTVICVLDETWNPDDQEQLEDRGMRNRTTPLNVLYFRSEDSIQEYIADVAGGKRITNKNVLDIRREIARRRKES